MADSLRSLIAATLAAHRDELRGGSQAGWYCTCGGWSMPYQVGPKRAAAELRLHWADAILAALDGRLLPEGGETR